ITPVAGSCGYAKICFAPTSRSSIAIDSPARAPNATTSRSFSRGGADSSPSAAAIRGTPRPTARSFSRLRRRQLQPGREAVESVISSKISSDCRDFADETTIAQPDRRDQSRTDLLDHDLLGRLPQVIARAHRIAVSTGVRDQQNVTLPRDGHQAIRPEPVARLADRPDDGHDLGRRLTEARQVRNLVIGAVERRADQAVHPGTDADVLHVALALRLRHAREQHAGLRNDVTPGLEPQLPRPARFLDLRQPAVEGLEIERPLAGSLRHAEPASEVEIAHLGEALEQRDELLAGIAPGLRREHAAARMRMQPDDRRAGSPDTPLELIELEHRHTELRMGAGRAHVLVMAAALTGIDANENLRAAEERRPRLERVEIVEREPYALPERPFVFVSRREVRRKQDPLAIDVREERQHALDL